MKKIKKTKWIIILLSLVMIEIIIHGNTQKVDAASKYIKVEDYIEYIVRVMDWDEDKDPDKSCIDVAMDKGILKKGDFKDYTAYLTRTDAAVIANRLDEYINPRYGYPQDVYEFLRDCTLFNYKLFYNTDGSLYPKGATRDTYPEEIFHEEVVMPILGEYFKDDNWKDRGLRTVYEYIRDDDGNTIRRYMEIGLVHNNKDWLSAEPIDKDSSIINAWNTINDGKRQLNSVLDYRISDIEDIQKSKREAVASIVSKGIIKGYSNGMYIQNREFRGNKKITDAGAKNVIQLVLNPEKRALISPDGQLIRTKNLPKNASDYKYVLECFPNKYYEMNFSFVYLTDYLSGEIRDDEYAYPKEIDYEFLHNKFYYNKMSLEMGKYFHYDAMLLSTEKYLKHIFDVDYRTVNDKWKKGLASSLGFYSWQDTVYEHINRYVENIKENRTVVEYEKIAIDQGAIYECRNVLRVRVYVKYRVIADDMSVPTSQLIYGPDTSIKDIGKGEWKESIFDIFMDIRAEDNIYKWRPSAFVSLSDWGYRDSFK